MEGLFEAMLEEAEVGLVQQYSGRGMYGRECLAVKTDMDLAGVIVELMLALFRMVQDEECTEDEMSEAATILANTSVDNMGHSFVYYWPELMGDR